MKLLVDTNVLTRMVDAGHPQHIIARKAVASASQRGDVPCLVPQNLYEFWVVCTRPASDNGLGFSTQLALATLDDFRDAFNLLDETPAIRLAWEELVVKHGVVGKAAHDTRLVAAMNVHGLTAILTFNRRHFLRYDGIDTLSPQELD